MSKSAGLGKFDDETLKWYKLIKDRGFKDIEINNKQQCYAAPFEGYRRTTWIATYRFLEPFYRLMTLFSNDSKYHEEKNVHPLVVSIACLLADGQTITHIKKELGISAAAYRKHRKQLDVILEDFRDTIEYSEFEDDVNED